MRKMKDSGIEWIGDIPADWQLSKISEVYQERNTKVSDRDYAALSVTKQGIVPQLDSAAKSDNSENRKLIKKNDFVINSRSDRRGSCGISNYDGSCSFINIVITPLRNMHNEYYSFLFRSELFADEFYRWGNGIVDDLWSTKWSSMKRIYIPLPPLPTQHCIADYLDDKCSKIDYIIEREQAVIEKLKAYKLSLITEVVTRGLNPEVPMKDSGIKWIGEIPGHWNVLRFKNVGCCRNGLTYSPADLCDESEGILVLRSSNIQNNQLTFKDNVFVNSQIHTEVMVRPNDILICSRNGSAKLIGKNALIPEGLYAAFGAFMMVFRCKNPNYIRYVLNSNIFAWHLATFLTSTVNQLTNGNFLNIQFCCPNSIIEQNEIVVFLDHKTTKIDSTIEKKQALIDKLTEYKKSLIYEVVTGKKEV